MLNWGALAVRSSLERSFIETGRFENLTDESHVPLTAVMGGARDCKVLGGEAKRVDNALRNRWCCLNRFRRRAEKEPPRASSRLGFVDQSAVSVAVRRQDTVHTFTF